MLHIRKTFIIKPLEKKLFFKNTVHIMFNYNLQVVHIMVFRWYFECFPFGSLGDVHTFGPLSDTTSTFVTMSTAIKLYNILDIYQLSYNVCTCT